MDYTDEQLIKFNLKHDKKNLDLIKERTGKNFSN